MDDTLIVKNLLMQQAGPRLAFVGGADVEAIARSVTALVNGEGGDVLVGIDEATKSMEGIPDAEAFRHELEAHLNLTVKPGAPCSITPFQVDGKTILLVSVWAGANKPYSYNNKIFIRRGAATSVADAGAVAALIEDRKQASFHWERQKVLGADMEELDRDEILRTMAQYSKDKHVIDFSDNVDEFLTYLGLCDNGNLTNAAILLFAKKPIRYLPQAKIRLTAFNGEKSGNTIAYDRQFEGNVFRNIESIWGFLTVAFGRSGHINGLQRTGSDNFPPVALREGLMNAIVHRDYATAAGTLQISLYPDRLQISNTGGLPGGISALDLRREHFSILRNPDIAQVCYIRGFIEMLGSGTLRMIRDCVERGFHEPEWVSNSDMTTLVFPGLSAIPHSFDGVKLPIEGVIEGVNQSNEGVNPVFEGVNEGVTKELMKLMGFIGSNGGMRVNELAKAMGKGESTIERYIKLLKTAGHVEFKGAPKNGGYHLINNKFFFENGR
jgi:ATP-dependent DNA helicase RecG